MTSSRDAFLQRVRQAVAQGNRAGSAIDLPERGTLGYQGAGLDPVAHFCDALQATGKIPVGLKAKMAVPQVKVAGPGE